MQNRSKLNCVNKNLVQKNYQKGQFWALENHVRAGHKNSVKCHDSVTVTSSADYRFLDNLIEQVKRWRSPISLALYAPGIDYRRSMQTIVYLRECLVDPNDSAMIKELVTFHLYFESKYMPKKVLFISVALQMCSLCASFWVFYVCYRNCEWKMHCCQTDC